MPGAAHAASGALVVAARVEDDQVRVRTQRRGQAGEVADRIGGKLAAGDADELAAGLGDLLLGLADQGDRSAPWDEPADVGDEVGDGQLEVQRPGQVAGGERGAGAQVDHPLAGGQSSGQLGGVDVSRRGEVHGRRAGGVARPHVAVPSRNRRQAGDQLVDEGLLVPGQGRVDLGLLADGGGVAAGRGGRTERAEAVAGEDRSAGGQLVDEPAHRVVLGMGELIGVLRTDQVRAAGGAVQHGTAGEHGLHLTVGVRDHVADVVVRVSGSVQHAEPHRAGLEVVPVGGRHPVVGDGVTGRDDVVGAHADGELEATGQVVVVQVGLQDQRDADGPLLGQGQHAVDVALGVDHDADPAVADQVAAVAEAGGLDDVDLHGRLLSTVRGRGICVANRRRRQAVGRPSAIHCVMPPSRLATS